MRVKVQKRNTPQEKAPHDLAKNSKMQEVTVTQHYHRNPMRKTMGNFPKVRYTSELPDEDNYRHLQSVFKFVDNFLSGASITDAEPQSPRRSPSRKKSLCRSVPKSMCIPGKNITRYVGGSSVARNIVVRKPTSLSLRVHGQPVADKVERVKTNVNNIIKKSSIRVSLKRGRCSDGQLESGSCNRNCKASPRLIPSPRPVQKTQYQTKKSPLTSDSDYVKTLIDEIKANKPELCNQKAQLKPCKASPRDDYVRKLREEVACNRSKSVDKARTIIQELQEEILTYRLQAKTKYSSSCSEIRSSDKPSLSVDQLAVPSNSRENGPIEKKQIGESPLAVHYQEPSFSRKEAPRFSKRCETLWKSKISMPSSTEFCTFPITQEIYFEEKLEEANSLIEKVRAALRDIGMGIPKVPEQTQEAANVGEAEPSFLSKCPKSCSYHGKCSQRNMEDEKKGEDVKTEKSRETSEERRSRSLNNLQDKAEEKQDESVKLTKSKDANIKIIVSKLLKKQELERELTVSCCGKMNEKKKSDRGLSECSENQCQKKYEFEETIRPEKDKEKREVVIITIQAAKRTVSEDLASESVDKLQGRLHCIAEKSENELPTDKTIDSKAKEDLKIPVTRMERGTSPINLPAEAESSEKPKIISPEEVHFVKDLKLIDDISTLNSVPLVDFQHSLASKEPESLAEEQSVNAQITTSSVLASETLTSSDDILRSKISQILYQKGSKFRDYSLDTKDIYSIANVIQPTNDRATKLSVQVMPTLSIRGGLVMQKTLNLSIKPTGSITNDVGGTHSNVGYQEINANPEQDLEVREIHKGACRDDCGIHCKFRSPESSIHSSSASYQDSKKRFSHALNKETLILYKSFQVLDEQICDDRRRATATPHNTESEDVGFRFRPSYTAESSRASVDSIQDVKYLPKTQRTPWQLGFYKTKATQCHERPRDDVQVPVPSTPRSPVYVTKANSVDYIPYMTESVDKAQIQKLVGTTTDAKEETILKSPDSVQSNRSASSDLTEAQPSRWSVQEVLNALKDELTYGSSKETFSMPQTAPEIPAKDGFGTPELEKSENKSNHDSSSSTSSSSSSSSYEIIGSVSSDQKKSYSHSYPADVVVLQSVAANKNVQPDEKVPDDRSSTVKSDALPSPSKKKSTAPKIDMSTQVSLGDSSSDESSGDSADQGSNNNTVSYFIKGLTGASKDDLDKLRSSPSFPKTELASWSRSVLKTLSRDKLRTDGVQDVEIEVDGLEYNERKPHKPDHVCQMCTFSHDHNDPYKNCVCCSKVNNKMEASPSPSILSEKTRMQRLQDFQKMASNHSAESKDNKKDREDTVMRFQIHKNSSGDQKERIQLSKRHLPFYRRVLSRIIDPSNKKMMKKSLSEPYPIDESVSEGEIRPKSHSIGEVIPYKYLERRKFAKNDAKYHKHQFGESSGKELGEIRITRQRAQYNNWVMYYLQKQEDKCVDDSESTSTVSRSS